MKVNYKLELDIINNIIKHNNYDKLRLGANCKSASVLIFGVDGSRELGVPCPLGGGDTGTAVTVVTTSPSSSRVLLSAS